MQVLRDAKASKADIHEVVLVGGSTRIPKVSRTPDLDLRRQIWISGRLASPNAASAKRCRSLGEV